MIFFCYAQYQKIALTYTGLRTIVSIQEFRYGAGANTSYPQELALEWKGSIPNACLKKVLLNFYRGGN